MKRDKPEIFAVIWVDLMLGNLSLPKATAAEAIESAQSMRVKGAGKIVEVRAVHLAAGSDRIDVLDGEAFA